jgi:hypothetical protein
VILSKRHVVDPDVMNGSNALIRLVAGAAAGAAGSAAVNTVTYLDMLIRGRSGSSVPKKDVQRLEDHASIDGPEDAAAQTSRSNRETAAGALMGYIVGVGVGTAAGLAWPLFRALPLPVAGAVVGGAAMAGGDIPSVALGTTDPRSWSATSWAADIVPHLTYGLVTVAVVASLLSD